MRILRFNNELTRWDTAAIDEVKRRTLDTKNYGLKFGPVSAEDSGTYLCLINNRREPDALLELTVEGKITLLIHQIEPLKNGPIPILPSSIARNS